jgi:integrase/recombinase XerD
MAEEFHSSLAAHIAAFLHEKRACGYRYAAETATLQRFDRFLCKSGCSDETLSRELVERWTARQPHERPRTHKAKLLVVRQLAMYLRRCGIQAYVPDSKLTPMARLDFAPYIFTREQVRRLLESVDNLPFDPRAPERHLVMPELFRVLYGCGLRAGEVLRLSVADVNVDQGVLTVRQGKFRKDRLVPMAPSLTERLRRYADAMNLRNPDAVFFPNPAGGRYSLGRLYQFFRRILRKSGIPHGGRNQGPRLHDLRHTFAVHCLERWYQQGEDLNARLPLLVTYLGHESLRGTQRYLRLTPAVFPDVIARLESFLHQSIHS